MAERKALEARADLEKLSSSRFGRVVGVVARVAQADDQTDALCGEVAGILDELEDDSGERR